MSAAVNISYTPATSSSQPLLLKVRFLAAPGTWWDAPSSSGVGWLAFGTPSPGSWFVQAVNTLDVPLALLLQFQLPLCNMSSPPLSCGQGNILIHLMYDALMYDPRVFFASAVVTNMTNEDRVQNMLPSTPVQYFSVYNKNNASFRISISSPDGSNSSTMPSVYLKWGTLPALDSWDAKDDR